MPKPRLTSGARLTDVLVVAACALAFGAIVLGLQARSTSAPLPPRIQVPDGGRPGGDGDGGAGRPPQREPPFERIARDLGLPADRVREAFREVGPPLRSGRPPGDRQRARHAEALAARLDLPVERLQPVLEKYRPAPPVPR